MTLLKVLCPFGFDGERNSDDGWCCGDLTTPAGEQARLVDSEDRDDPAVAPVSREEATVVAAAFLDRDLVVGMCNARELDPRPVLVGPEVRRLDMSALVDAAREQCRNGDRRPF